MSKDPERITSLRHVVLKNFNTHYSFSKDRQKCALSTALGRDHLSDALFDFSYKEVQCTPCLLQICVCLWA